MLASSRLLLYYVNASVAYSLQPSWHRSHPEICLQELENVDSSGQLQLEPALTCCLGMTVYLAQELVTCGIVTHTGHA